MRVLILNQFYIPDISPTAHLAASLAEDRAARGDDVTVMTSRGGYVYPQSNERSGATKNLRIVHLWTPQFGKGSHLRRLIDYASFYLLTMLRVATLPKQDVIVSMTTPPFIALAGALHKTMHPDTRLILWNMDCYPDVIERYGLIRKDGFVSRMLRRINREIFDRVDHLVGLDQPMIQLLHSQYASRDLPSSVISNWESASIFNRGVYEASRRNFQIPGSREKFTILYIGNVGYGHLFDTVLDAAELLRGEPVQFVICGGGARWTQLDAARNARGLENVVMKAYLAVPTERLPEHMSGAKCSLITLRDDALGLMSPSKMHASLAMGLPVIYVGPEKSNVDEAIRRFDCGISLRHGQSAELVAFVRKMIADEQALEAFRARARQAFDEAYCDARTLPQFDAVFRPSE